MSTVFSRRSFLKYTAVTAVAVAGTSLLGGCSGSGAETAIQTTYPSDNVVLKVKTPVVPSVSTLFSRPPVVPRVVP